MISTGNCVGDQSLLNRVLRLDLRRSSNSRKKTLRRISGWMRWLDRRQPAATQRFEEKVRYVNWKQ